MIFRVFQRRTTMCGTTRFVVFVALSGVISLVSGCQRATPDQKMAEMYEHRFESRRAKIEQALDSLPAPEADNILEEDKLSGIKGARVVIADFLALQSPDEVRQRRVWGDPFAARLHFWRRGQATTANYEAGPSARQISTDWPTDLELLAKAYERFLEEGPRYVAIVRHLDWHEPNASEHPIVAGFIDAEVFILDLETATVLASHRLQCDQSMASLISVRPGSEQRSAEDHLRMVFYRKVYEWLDNRFEPDQNVKIGSEEWDLVKKQFRDQERPLW